MAVIAEMSDAMNQNDPQEVDRRSFLKGIAGGAAGAAMGANLLTSLSSSAQTPNANPQPAAPYRGPRSDKIIKIGVVGGNFGRQFFWHLHPNSKVTAVCDLRDDRLKAMAETYQCGNTYKDFRSRRRWTLTPALERLWRAQSRQLATSWIVEESMTWMTFLIRRGRPL